MSRVSRFENFLNSTSTSKYLCHLIIFPYVLIRYHTNRIAKVIFKASLTHITITISGLIINTKKVCTINAHVLEDRGGIHQHSCLTVKQETREVQSH